MNKEQQQIAIAKACFWTINSLDLSSGWRKGVTNFTSNLEYLPDYLNDLNAMHEAEKVLYQDPNLPKKYTQQIKAAICREAGVKKAKMDFDVCITATAAQRAEAFLKTIDKWTNNQPTEP